MRHFLNSHHRWIGIACLALGLALITPLMTHYVINRWEQHQLQEAWKNMQDSPQEPTPPPQTNEPQPEPKALEQKAPESVPQPIKYPAAIIGRISIPKMGLDDIVLEGTTLEILQYGPGHLEDTPYPGHSGNAIIAAHNDLEFHTLGNLQSGDLVYFTDSKGKKLKFRVEQNQIIGPNDVIPLKTAEPTLTLSTCYPFNGYRDTPYRYIVTAHLI